MPDSPAPTISTSKWSVGIVLSAPRFVLAYWPATGEAFSRWVPVIFVKPWMPGTSPGTTNKCDLTGFSVAVMVRLERAFGLHADIFGLIGPQFGQLHTDL